MPPSFEILLPTERSADAVGVVEINVPARWDGPPLHHHDFDESFYVLDGELTFQLGETLQSAVPGELVFAPRGAVHTLANLGDRPARYLLVCTPGPFTRYFEQLNGAGGNATYPETIVVGPTIGERVAR
jgi:mannose-6-phosphate isomerase-like protein (cupin superfamily)